MKQNNILKTYLSLLFILTTKQSLASVTDGSCARSFQTIQEFVSRFNNPVPGYVKKTLKISGLTAEDIKDSIILDVGSRFTDNFVGYAQNEMGAKQALAVDFFKNAFPPIVPEHFLLKMHPLIGTNSPNYPPFEAYRIRQRLNNNYADITLSLSVIGKYSLQNTQLWLNQLTKVTKPEGTIIIDFGKHKQKGIPQVTAKEFEEILSQMKKQGIILSYEATHTNHTGLSGTFRSIILPFPLFYPSVTYKITNGKAKSPYSFSKGNVIPLFKELPMLKSSD